MVKICLFLTLCSSLPAFIKYLYLPTNKNFKLTQFIISMSFFLFSYHVHEKSILFPFAYLTLNFKLFDYLDSLEFII